MQSLKESSKIQGGGGLDPMNPFSFLNLTTAVTASPSDEHQIHRTKCISRSNSNKKRRYSTVPRLTRHKKKYPERHHHQQQEQQIHHQQGFTKIDLPIPFPSPVLRRSFSDAYNNPGTTQPAASPTDFLNSSPHTLVDNNNVNDASPVNLLGACVNASNGTTATAAATTTSTNTTPSPIKGSSSPFASLPPRPRSVTPLFRSVSDPSHVTSIVPVSVVKDDSPNSKRLKRMKDSMTEMNQWLCDIISEGEDDDDSSDQPTSTTPKQATFDSGSDEREHEDNDEEEVSVERFGDYLSVNFKCPCGNGYQILLSGNHCYYKLL